MATTKKKKSAAKKCESTGCKKKASRGNYCGGCRTKRYREAHPMEAAYQNLRTNAKRRGHEFTLTQEEFKRFCVKTDYLMGKGRTKESFSIDRIDPERGYSLDNIQLMTVSENSKKGRKKVLEYYPELRTARMVEAFSNSNWEDPNNPF